MRALLSLQAVQASEAATIRTAIVLLYVCETSRTVQSNISRTDWMLQPFGWLPALLSYFWHSSTRMWPSYQWSLAASQWVKNNPPKRPWPQPRALVRAVIGPEARYSTTKRLCCAARFLICHWFLWCTVFVVHQHIAGLLSVFLELANVNLVLLFVLLTYCIKAVAVYTLFCACYYQVGCGRLDFILFLSQMCGFES